MNLSQLLEKLAGRFELTVFVGDEDCACEDAEICQDEEQVNWGKVINGYSYLKDVEVRNIYITKDRDYSGAAIWVTVKA